MMNVKYSMMNGIVKQMGIPQLEGNVHPMSATRRRNSLRLMGYDYSQPGEYFVTICTTNRMRIFGNILKGRMRLSAVGEIVQSCWRKIPEHFPNTKVDTFQIMPNHVHAIIQIKENTRRGEVTSPLTRKGDKTSPLRKVTVGKVVAYLKYQSTKQINEIDGTPGKKVFQRNYYDHIIRDDIDHFFVEQYIELNPIMWELDADNPNQRGMSIDVFRKTLEEEHGLSGFALERVIEYELGYHQCYEK